MRGSRRRRFRRATLAGVVAGLTAVAAGLVPAPAGAAITAFTVSPASGPPGSVMEVSGTGCSPGLLGSLLTDYVAVTAPTLAVAIRVPVSASGAWHGSFTVPASAGGGSNAVAALCVSAGLQSLTTLYTPRTFTVSAAPAPTLPTVPTLPTLPTLPGLPGTSTTTPRGPGGGPPPTTGTNPPDDPGTVVIPGEPAVVIGVPGGDGAGTETSNSDGAAHPVGRGKNGSGRAPGTAKRAADAGPATLQQANFGSFAPSDGGRGLGWLGRLLLLALLIAAGGATFLIRRARRAREAAATDGEPQGGAA